MQRLKLAASKIPIELMDRLNRLTELTGLTQSAAIRQAIEYYLDNAELTGLAGLTAIKGNLTPSQLVPKDNPFISRLTAIEARLELLESRSPSKTAKPIAAAVASPKPKREPSTGLMGTTEAWEQLTAIGYSKALPTLRRHLATAIGSGQLPTDLVALGLVADFEVRRSANPKDNSVRWLWFEADQI